MIELGEEYREEDWLLMVFDPLLSRRCSLFLLLKISFVLVKIIRGIYVVSPYH